MAYSTINKSTAHFDGKTYLGSSSAVTVSGLEFQPDLVWVKDRDNGNNHCLVDAVRGVGKYLKSDANTNQTTNSSQSISAFTSDGFTTGTGNPANESASTTLGFMSWNWKANGQGSSNTAGSINTTYTSVNSTADFSISTYTGTGSTATVGHGLSGTPDVVLVKSTNDNTDWRMYHKDIPSANTRAIKLNDVDYWNTDNSWWNNTSPTSTLVTLGSSSTVNQSGNLYVMYCWKSVNGFSKYGSFIGNGNANGSFTYLGFKPKLLIVKNQGASASWVMVDDKRLGYNVKNRELFANNTNVEETNDQIDLLSNGFKMRANSTSINTAGRSYLYLAWGQTLVGSNNKPCTAR